ncbi:hypothetical protein CTRI78_v010882 [Colletotrichum trifolii]|uniref:Uncharacterized protein n=1 Tax=Colletotrichum trifolii TaxID=5466 RepID=A0A4R8QHE7_COLTR|nr:hypothetical protein CTRI78_v010882 [Colletotrichum trifolii]
MLDKTTSAKIFSSPAAPPASSSPVDATKRYDPICEPKSCGPACKKRAEPPSTTLSMRRKKRWDTQDGVWPEPGHLGQPDTFLQEEIRKIMKNEARNGFKPRAVKIPPESFGDDAAMTSSSLVTFKDKVEELAVEGLHGCTSIVLVSRRGAYANHIWESNFWSDVKFATRALVEPHWGLDDDAKAELLEYMEFGLVELRNNGAVGPPGVMFGDHLKSAMDLGMKAFIVTPRTRLSHVDPGGSPILDKIMEDPNVNLGTLMFPEKVRKLEDEIRSLFGDNVPIEVVDYHPKQLGVEDWKKFNEGKISDEEASDLLSDKDYKSPRGKVLLQYQPAREPTGRAAWRLWIDRMQVGRRNDIWPPEPDQVFNSSAQITIDVTVKTTVRAPSSSPASTVTPQFIKNKGPSISPTSSSTTTTSTTKSSSTTTSTTISPPTSSSPKRTPVFRSDTTPISMQLRDLAQVSQGGDAFPPGPTTLSVVRKRKLIIPTSYLYRTRPPLKRQIGTEFKEATHTVLVDPSPAPVQTEYQEFTATVFVDPSLAPVQTEYKQLTATVFVDPSPAPVPTQYKELTATVYVDPSKAVTTVMKVLTSSQTSTTSKTTMKMTTTTKKAPSPPPKPMPSMVVQLYLQWSWKEGPFGDTSPGGKWIMLGVDLDQKGKIVCRTALERPAGTAPLPPRFNPRSPGLPPTMTATEEIFGKKGCKYTGGFETASSGKFACDGVPEFDCEPSPQENEELRCVHGDFLTNFTPKAKCSFPVGK